MRLQLRRAARVLGAGGSNRRAGTRLLGLWLVLALGLFAQPAAVDADAASGTYTGSVSLRGNYYWERSTRVIAPAAHMTLESPRGVRAEATYLVDAITSASQATGVQSDVAFTETRHDVSAGLGYEIDLGATQLDLSARARFSHEPDYFSRGVGFGAALSMNQRMSVLSLNGYFLRDDVSMVVRMSPADDPTRLVAARPVEVGVLNALSLGIAWDQVLTPTLTFTFGYDAALLEGYQANPYRTAAFANGGGAPENHPDLRVREAVYAWFSQYVRRTRSALKLGYRLYRDSWDILAHAPEARVYQQFGPHAEIRLRYRYYTQNHAFFYRSGGNLREDVFVTADPKMSAFQTQTLGVKLRVELGFLAFTALDPLHTAVLDFGVEYVFNTNRFGDGLIGQGGFGWAF